MSLQRHTRHTSHLSLPFILGYLNKRKARLQTSFLLPEGLLLTFPEQAVGLDAGGKKTVKARLAV